MWLVQTQYMQHRFEAIYKPRARLESVRNTRGREKARVSETGKCGHDCDEVQYYDHYQ